MLYDIYKKNSDGADEPILSAAYCDDIVERLTGISIGDTLPVILPEHVAPIYNGMRSMLLGTTFQHNEYIIVRIK